MVKIAVLGCGGIARKMAQTLRMMRDNGESVCLYAAAARDRDRAEAFAREEGFLRAYGSYEEMVRDPDVHLVYVATPHSHHARHMKLCLENGKPVLCEKAFTRNAREAREALDLAKEKHLLAAEAIWTRYQPSYQMIRDLIRRGELGDIRRVKAVFNCESAEIERIYKPELAGGALLDLGVYALNFAFMFLGTDYERVETEAQLLPTGVDRSERTVFHYPGGCTAEILSCVTAPFDCSGMIEGTKGILTVDCLFNPATVLLNGREIPLPKQLTGYEYEVRACMKALADGEIECPEMPHDETLRLMEIMDGLRLAWGVRYPGE